jgi:hypothetical protein
MVASNLFRNKTRKMKFPPMMIRPNGKQINTNYPSLPASPSVNTNKNINNLFDPVYNGNTKKYLATLRNRYKTRNQRLRVLNRNLNMNVTTKRNLRKLI